MMKIEIKVDDLYLDQIASLLLVSPVTVEAFDVGGIEKLLVKVLQGN